jgi:hypothetical protein
MELLIFFAIAAVCALGWFGGNRFVCVFLSMPIGALMLLAANTGGEGTGKFMAGCLVALAAIWLPFVIRRAHVP